jgi:hypothetical protein
MVLLVMLNGLERLEGLDIPLGFGPSGDWHIIIYETIETC